MIQRIQSLYLVLSVLLLAFSFGTPIAEFTKGTTLCKMTAVGYDVYGTPGLAEPTTCPWGVLCLTVVLIGVAVYTLLQYRRRMRQIALCNLSIVLHLFYFFTYATYSIAFAQGQGMSYAPGFFLLLPVASLVLTWLARQGVKADEEKVRAADRIR